MASNVWTINFLPEQGGRITGKLTLTEEQIQFRGLYDSSTAQIVKGIGTALGTFAASGGHASYFHDSGTDFGLNLPRADVDRAELRKKLLLMKQAVVTMKDGSTFVFDYGLLSPAKLIDAINRV